jgi:membrane protein
MRRLRDRARARWRRAQQRAPWLAHLVTAWRQLNDQHGNLYAAAITYFSFLALFPLLLLGIAIAGFVLHAHPAALASLLDNISRNVPGSFGTTLQQGVKSAISARTGVGLIGVGGVLLTGLGWIANLRAAVNAVWGFPPERRSFFIAKRHDLPVLVGFGLGVLVSLGLTTVGTALADVVLRQLHAQHDTAVRPLLAVLGILLAIAGDLVIFWWLIVRLVRVQVPRGIALRGALLAAVGFEALKIIGTYTVAATSRSATAGPFAGVVAILVWLQLVSRFALFSVAWTATAPAMLAAGPVHGSAYGSAPGSVQPAGVPVRDTAAEQEDQPERDQPQP